MKPIQFAKYLFNKAHKEGIAKFMVGAVEHAHKGNIYEIPMPAQIQNAKEEVIDLVSYVWTLEWQQKQMGDWLQDYFDLQDAKEEPQSADEITLKNNIKALAGLL